MTIPQASADPAEQVAKRAAARGAGVLFACFFFSGFTGLLYQTIWLRLALGAYGVNSAVISTVLTVFMLGLTLGTALAGRWTVAAERRFGCRGLQLYAATELAIAIGGVVVPALLAMGRQALLSAGAATSLAYTAASALVIAVALLPFCIAMGATFPIALSYLKRAAGDAHRGYSFSYLYLANVAGALFGVLLTSLVLIELLGFRASGYIGAFINVGLALIAFFMVPDVDSAHEERPVAMKKQASHARLVTPRMVALFLTGFCSMGMEVVWTRLYPYFIGTFVYSFAGILATYLVATALGSMLYRWRMLTQRTKGPWSSWHWLCVAAMLPLFSASLTYAAPGPLRIVVGLAPFCFILGFITPFLLDDQGGNDPARVGRAYAVNLLGCVIGPLLAGFVLIPQFGTRIALLILIVPLFLFLLARPVRTARPIWMVAVVFAAATGLWLNSTMFEERFPKELVRFDHTATVAVGSREKYRYLFVNGVGMTKLTPVTKMMAHFPMAHVQARGTRPSSGLVVCLGMGTSFRSMASWGGQATVVELVPSVAEFLTYFFPDATALLTDPRLRIEIDDGRRFLDRTDATYDVITLDPPPPPEASGSSLLYSKEFYRSAARRLKPGGILQAWFPGGDRETLAAVTLALLESFPHVRGFTSLEGWGYHFLASQTPIPRASAEELLRSMPDSAVRDMTEWGEAAPIAYLQRMLTGEFNPRRNLLARVPGGGTALTDDRPVNEFFFVRRYLTPTKDAAGKPGSAGGH